MKKFYLQEQPENANNSTVFLTRDITERMLDYRMKKIQTLCLLPDSRKKKCYNKTKDENSNDLNLLHLNL